MKKLISLVTLVAVIASFSLCAFAEDVTITLPEGELTELTATDGVYEVEASSTGAYATILAVKGKTIKVGAIQYINQDVTTEGKATFSFALNEDLLTADATNTATEVYVLTGGDGNVNVLGYIETKTEEPAPTTFKVYGYVADAEATVYLGDVNVKVDSTGAYAFEEMAVGAYELIVKAPGAFTRPAITVDVVDADVLVADAENATTLKYGLVREDATKVEIDDLNVLLNAYGKTSDLDAYKLTCDFDRNGKVEIDDLNRLLNNYGKTAEDVYAAE